MTSSQRSQADLADAFEPAPASPEPDMGGAAREALDTKASDAERRPEARPAAEPLDRLSLYLLGPTVYCA